jgi:predicted small lipoprotein YifL
MNAKTTLSALAAALLLAACGNKGPLVMPQKPVPVEQETPAPPPADATPAPPAEPVEPVEGDPADPDAVPTDGGNG